jgi:hypothetical protein
MEKYIVYNINGSISQFHEKILALNEPHAIRIWEAKYPDAEGEIHCNLDIASEPQGNSIKPVKRPMWDDMFLKTYTVIVLYKDGTAGEFRKTASIPNDAIRDVLNDETSKGRAITSITAIDWSISNN